MVKYSVGLDVSSKKINMCFVEIDGQQVVKTKASSSISNTNKGFIDLHNWIQKHRKNKDIPLVVCMEATGVYHEECAFFLAKHDYHVSVVLANYAKKYLDSLGQKSKNDKIDAKGIAQMAAERSLTKWSPMGEYFYILRGFTRQHQSLQEAKTVTGSQLHALKRTMYRQIIIEDQLEKHLQFIENQIKEVETLISMHVKSNEVVEKHVKNICKIPGVGLLTASVIIAETNGFELFKNAKQLVSYSGYDVVENQSGKHTGKTKISKKGNSRIRRILFMPAFSTITCGERVFKNLFDRTLAKHHITMKSYVAVQKKLLTTIYALWKSDSEFNTYYGLTEEEITKMKAEKEVEVKAKKSSSNRKDGATQGNRSKKNLSPIPLS